MDYEEGEDPKALPVLQKVGINSWLRAHGKVVRPELTKKQRMELQECFDLIDSDGSGTIDVSDLLTAFSVLGLRVKRSEIESMLSTAAIDGTATIDYHEFVQIMTSKMDIQSQKTETEPKQPFPFRLLAQAYRRKKLMEAIMEGDKQTQDRLQAKADAVEADRVATISTAESKKQYKKTRSRSQIRRSLIGDLTLPKYVMDSMDEDAKAILFNKKGIHPALKKINASCDVHPQSLANLDGQKNTVQQGIILPAIGDIKSMMSGENILQPSKQNWIQNKEELQHHREKVQNKPVLEQQLLRLRAIKSIQNYNKYRLWDTKDRPETRQQRTHSAASMNFDLRMPVRSASAEPFLIRSSLRFLNRDSHNQSRPFGSNMRPYMQTPQPIPTRPHSVVGNWGSRSFSHDFLSKPPSRAGTYANP